MTAPDLSHDRQAWLESIVERYERPLLAYAARLLAGDLDRAEDAVQETLLRLCRADVDSLSNKIPAWLFAVCRTRVIDMRRTEHPASTDADLVPAPERSPEAQVERADTHRHVQVLVSRLPDRQQELLHLRLHAGLSYQEIADATGMSVSNVGYQLHVAIRSLRESMLSESGPVLQPSPG